MVLSGCFPFYNVESANNLTITILTYIATYLVAISMQMHTVAYSMYSKKQKQDKTFKRAKIKQRQINSDNNVR